MQYLISTKFRKRKIQTLVLLLTIALLFFLLQFFSLSKLNNYRVDKLPEKQKVHMTFNQSRENLGLMNNGLHYPSHVLVNKTIQEPVLMALPRGVHPSFASQYVSNEGIFRCLESKVTIPFDQINDDYCDCLDSSDEPGTAACQNGRFYCKVQLPQREWQHVHASKVNDGICDCCDGSDEWAGQEVPLPMKLKGKVGAVFHAPCANHCENIMKLMEDENRIRRQGLLLQKQYVDAAKNLSRNQKEKYGPSGIFYSLSHKCFEHLTHEYRYTVCPFQSVRQNKGVSVGTYLGRNGQWVHQKAGDYLLTMGQGDPTLCPDGLPRQTHIHFVCGLEDNVITINEDQKCRYIIKFSSPAAC